MSSPSSILIVDDSAKNRMVLHDFLTSFGHSSVEAENGRAALAHMERERPSLVLLDIMMPVMDGYEVLDRMKTDPMLRHVPVVVISAVDALDSVVRCLEQGADDYLVKPFNPTLLRARVTASLEKSRLRQAEERHREETEAALAMKTLLMKIATHDLRNPLTLILGFVRFLREDAARGTRLSAKSVSDLERVEEAARRMQRLIGTFLSYQELQSGVLPVRLADENVTAVVSAVVADMTVRAKEKVVTLQNDIVDDEPMVVRCDKDRLYQVLENLVSNALKFSPRETRVIIRRRLDTQRVRLEIQDAGPGIPPAERARLFQEFAKLSNRPTGSESSTGLGLYVARRLIEAQHGTIGAEFPAEGGSIFWFELPRNPDAKGSDR